MLQAHLQLETINAKYAILPGDPKRIDVIKTFLDNPKELMYNREFRSVEGTYKGIPQQELRTHFRHRRDQHGR